MKKSGLLRSKTIARNLALYIEARSRTPRWLAYLRLVLGALLSMGMLWIGVVYGFTTSALCSAMSIVGALTLTGIAILIFGGYLSQNFWKKVEHTRRSIRD